MIILIARLLGRHEVFLLFGILQRWRFGHRFDGTISC